MGRLAITLLLVNLVMGGVRVVFRVPLPAPNTVPIALPCHGHRKHSWPSFRCCSLAFRTSDFSRTGREVDKVLSNGELTKVGYNPCPAVYVFVTLSPFLCSLLSYTVYNPTLGPNRSPRGSRQALV